MNRFTYLLFFLLFFIVACTHTDLNKTEETDNWLSDDAYFADRQSHYDSLVTWQYSAKVAVKSEATNQQANLVWLFSDQANSVRLYGPLGIGQIKVEFDQYGVQLSDNKGILHQGLTSHGQSAEQLLTEITNLPIPMDALSYWLFVVPAPEHVFRYQLNEQENVSVIEQLGWKIEYSGYRNYNGNFLPRKLTATREYADSEHGTIVVKLITKEWK